MPRVQNSYFIMHVISSFFRVSAYSKDIFGELLRYEVSSPNYYFMTQYDMMTMSQLVLHVIYTCHYNTIVVVMRFHSNHAIPKIFSTYAIHMNTSDSDDT